MRLPIRRLHLVSGLFASGLVCTALFGGDHVYSSGPTVSTGSPMLMFAVYANASIPFNNSQVAFPFAPTPTPSCHITQSSSQALTTSFMMCDTSGPTLNGELENSY